MKLLSKFCLSLMVLSLLTACAFAADNAEKIRVGVLAFESKTSGVSQTQAEAITDMFTSQLTGSPRVEVYERLQMDAIGKEIKMGMSGLIDMNTAVEVGKIAGLQYILVGSVTELSQKASGGGFYGIVQANHEARATIDMRVIEVATSRVAYAVNATGTSKNTGQGFAIGGFTYVEAEFDGIEARAIADAVATLSMKLRSEMAGEGFHVISVADKEYHINVRAQPGALYLVYADGKTILDMDGNVIDRQKIPFAVLKVTDAGAAYSTAVLADGCSGALIKRGDKIENISAARAKELVTGKKFAKDRPSASSSTFDEIFGGGGGASSGAATPPSASSGVSEAPASTPPTPAVTPTASPTPSAPAVKIDGFDPNTSSDGKVIETYALDTTMKNNLGIMHRSSFNMYSNKRYKDAYEGFKRGIDSYDGHYLAAYWAGMTAQKLKLNDEAKEWFQKALSINPKYEPATEALGKMK